MSALHTVHAEVRRLRRRAALVAAVLPAAVFLGALTSFARALADGGWLALPRPLPFLAWGVALAAAVALGRFLRRLAQRAEPAQVAAAIEREQGLRRGALVGVLEVEGSGVFADHAVAEAERQLTAAADRPAPQLRRRLQRATVLAVIALVQVLLLASSSYARRPDGWRALVHPVDAWRGALVGPLRFEQPPTRVQRGEDVALLLAAPGRREVEVRWRARGDGWRRLTLPVDADGQATATVPAVAADLTVVVNDGRAGYDSITVAVTDRPFVGDVRVLARYPAYLGRGDEQLPADAPLRVPAGTRLEVRARASTALVGAALVHDDGREALTVDGPRLAATLLPRRSGRWHWEAQGAERAVDDLPAPLDVDVVPDSLPRVEILAPTGERMVDAEAVIALELLAQDDYGLRDVALRVARVGAGPETAASRIALAEGGDVVWNGLHTLRLAPYALEPGQVLEVTLVARDAAPGQRQASSATLRLRVPTASEARAAADAAAESAVAAADAAAAAQAALNERTALEARARGDRGAESDVNDPRAAAQRQAQAAGQAPTPGGQADAPREALGYEGAERAREISREQQALREQVERLEGAARELEDRLRQAGALDDDLQRQLAEAQRLMREAMTPEMLAAMQQVEDATQRLDGARTRQSLQQLAQQQQRMREQLERSAEMLRRAALEGQMQTMADRGQELAQQQQAMADSAGGRPPSAEQAQAMQRQSEDLARQAQQLAERLQQAQAQAGAERTARAAEQAQQAADAMQQAARDPQGGQQAAQRAADAMQQAANDLSQARERQVGEWKAELTEALDRSVQEMMQLASQQDQLAQQAREGQQSGQPQQGLRGQQSALQQGVQTAQQRLAEESKKSALVSQRTQELMERAQQRAAAAAREAAAGRGGQTEQAMRESADALRQAAAQLTRDRERAGNSASATGVAEMLRQMQELARQQGGLNAQMQSIMPNMQPQGGQQQGQAEAARAQARQMARAQREVARQLDEISDADPSGKAQELAREARVLAAALDQGAVDPSTKARQEQLLRRMLDAGRSLENDQRDETARREARAARGTSRLRPEGPSSGAAAERYRVPSWDELRGLSPEDRRLVIDYFRRLNAEAKP